MESRIRGWMGPALSAGGVIGAPLGGWMLGPIGVATGILSLLFGVIVGFGPALLAYRAAKELGPRALAAGGCFDATCAMLQFHIGPEAASVNTTPEDRA